MLDLFPACEAVLRDELRPLHYAELTMKALEKIGIMAVNDIDLYRVKKDVREKLLCARRYGTRYTGAPLCFAYLGHWVQKRQLFNPDYNDQIIPFSGDSIGKGISEAIRREPHMLTKEANTYSRREAILRGLILQQHVSDWFKDKWPGFWQSPDNEGLYKQACSHDFKLHIGGNIYEVDAMGRHRDGTFGMSDRKHLTDLHLVASISTRGIIFHGFLKGSQMPKIPFMEWETNPACWLIVWLNCELYEYDYRSLL
jgi:hypothetical protein